MFRPPNNNEFPEVSLPGSPEDEGTDILPQVKGYEIVKKLGDGGMGVVYLAEQKEPIKRQAALKIIKPGMDSAKVIARFEAERQTLALLEHPNIARVFEAGTTRLGRPYFAMEYVKGVRITDYCDLKQLNIEGRLELFIQVCQAIQHAHQKGFIHRDIKPSNVLISIQDDQAIPKIIDFGVAKALSQQLTERTMFTEEGQLIGTPEYMSPEQADLVNQDIDTRSDIYSLGVLLYELLTGTLPFDRETLHKAAFVEIQRIIRDEEPPRPSTKLSSLGDEATEIVQNRQTELPSLIKRLYKELEWIPLKAMRKERGHRYQSASVFADDIRNYLDGKPLIAGPESTAYRLKKAIKRHRAFIAGMAAVIVVLVVGVVVSTIFAFRAWKAEKDAKQAWQVLLDDPARQVQASMPRPSDGSVNINPSKNKLLMWVPALDVSEQRVYFGLDPLNLELIKTLKQQNFVQHPELEPGRTYFWQVNGVKSDGSDVEGAFWRFSTGSLICWYRFDEKEGEIAEDSSGFGRHAKLVNGPAWQDGRFGGALSFDGADDYVSTGLTPSQLGIRGNSPRTITAWVFVRRFNDGGIFEMGRYSLGQEFSLRTDAADNYYRIEYYGGRNILVGIDSKNRWIHLAHAHDGAKTTIYADGVRVASAERVLDTGEDRAFAIGRWGTHCFEGLLDDFRIYSYALDEAQIKALQAEPYSERAATPYPRYGENLGRTAGPIELSWTPARDASVYKVYFGTNPTTLQLLKSVTNTTSVHSPELRQLNDYFWRVDVGLSDGSEVSGDLWTFSTGKMVAWYRFDETKRRIAFESSGSNLKGKLIGDAHVASDPTRGNVLRLDGDGDYMDCGNNPSFEIRDEITIAAWVKVDMHDKWGWYPSVVTKGDSAWRLQLDHENGSPAFSCTGLKIPGGNSWVNMWGFLRGDKRVDDGEWHHITGVYDGSRMYIFVDGVVDTSQSAFGQINTNNYPVYIGENAEQRDRYLCGFIDDLRIYNCSLDETLINVLISETRGL